MVFTSMNIWRTLYHLFLPENEAEGIHHCLQSEVTGGILKTLKTSQTSDAMNHFFLLSKR